MTGGLGLVLLPLVTAVLLFVPVTQKGAERLAPFTALPAFFAAVWGEPGRMDAVPFFLLGGLFGLDDIGRAFLLFTSVIWTSSGVYAREYLASDPRRNEFFGFYLAALAGNLGVALAADVASFYLFFALMSYAAYGLVVHERTRFALRAGRIYVILTVFGEAFLLAGVFLTVDAIHRSAPAPEPLVRLPDFAPVDLRLAPRAIADGGRTLLTSVLLFSGFGVKAGVLGLHVWLPLAHPAAPAPGSAVLSGTMIKAGLLGWLRFLPLGHGELAGLGTWVIVLGLLATFYGVGAGLRQRDAKALLAYSSISQMGLMTVAVGAALSSPPHARFAMLAATLFALHHGFSKAVLFLSAGTARHWGGRLAFLLAVGGAALGALSLAGAPLTAGAAAKKALTEAVVREGPLAEALSFLLTLSSVATALLLTRFLGLLPSGRTPADSSPGAPVFASSLVLALAGVGVLWILPGLEAPRLSRATLGLSSVLESAWPVVLGAAAYLGSRAYARETLLRKLEQTLLSWTTGAVLFLLLFSLLFALVIAH